MVEKDTKTERNSWWKPVNVQLGVEESREGRTFYILCFIHLSLSLSHHMTTHVMRERKKRMKQGICTFCECWLFTKNRKIEETRESYYTSLYSIHCVLSDSDLPDKFS